MRFLYSSFSLVLYLIKLQLQSCGHIYSWDVSIEYQNAGEARYFTFYFSLESGLPIYNQIQIDFPRDVSAASERTSCLLSSISVTPSAGCTLTSLSKSLIVTTNLTLSPNEWYQLRVEMANMAAQIEGYQGTISMTTQSTGTNKIKYDSNSAMTVYQLALKPANIIEVTQSNPAGISDRLKATLGQTNDYYFDIDPRVPVDGGTKWVIAFDKNDFVFTSTCISQAVNCALTDILCNPIALTEGACTIDPTGQRLTFLTNANITYAKKFRIKATIRNPIYYVSSTGYYVTSESRVSKLYFEKRFFPQRLIVNQITISAPIVRYLWGIPVSDGSTYSRCKIGFFKSGPSYKVFNNFILDMKIPVTPTNLNLKVSFLLPSSLYFSILSSSISTTLPTFPSKTLNIVVTATTLEIWNVGPLTDAAGNLYELRGRCYFSKDTTIASFLAIKIEALNSAGAVISQIGLSASADMQILKNYEYTGGKRTLNDYDYHSDTVVKKYGYIFVSAKHDSPDYTFEDSQDLISTQSRMRPGIPLLANSKVQGLLFTIYPGYEHICCSESCEQTGLQLASCLDTQTPYIIMLGMVANLNIINVKIESSFGVQILNGFWGDTAAPLNDGCKAGGTYTQYGNSAGCNNNILNDWVIDDVYNVAHLKLQNLGMNKNYITRGDITAKYPAGFVLRETEIGAGIFKESMELFSQLYGGQQVLDFVVCFNFKQNQASVTEEGMFLASQSLLNTYIIQKSSEPYLRIRLVNYIRQASDTINYAVPVFLRVYGKLVGHASGSTMAIFLDDNFNIGTFTEGNCISTVVGVYCNAYPEDRHVSYSNVNFRQRVDIVGANPEASDVIFDYFIPVKTVVKDFISNPPNFFIDFGVLKASLTDSRFSTVVSITRIYGYPWGLEKVQYPFSNNDPTISNSITIGTSGSAGTQSHEKACRWTNTDIFLPLNLPNFDPGYNFVSGMEFLITNTEPSCLGKGSDADLFNTGVIFTHRSIDIVGAAEVKWILADNMLCKKYGFSSNDLKLNSMGFICIISDRLSEPSDLLSSVSTLKISQFQVPWTWGQFLTSVDLDLHISFSAKGENAGYHSHPGFTQNDNNFASSCLSTDWSTINRNTKGQFLKFTFTPSNGIDLILDGTDEFHIKIVATPTLVSTGWSELKCRVTLSTGESLVCGVEYPFIVFKSSVPTVKSLSKNNQEISYYGHQDSTSITEKAVSLEIYYKKKASTRIKIDSCDQAQPKKIPASSTEDIALLKLDPPFYSLSKGARTSFNFTFGISGSTRQLWKDSALEFSLGWLGEKLGEVSQNIHCYIKEGNQISFRFSELDMSSPATPKLKLGADSPIGIFTFNCNGAISPSGTSSAEMKFTWKDSSTILAEMNSDSTLKPPIRDSFKDFKGDMTVSLENKFFNIPGFEANYNFSVTPNNENYTTNGRIYIDFPVDTPPRGNKAGQVFCSVQDVDAHCDFIEERCLSIWLPLELTWRPAKPYQIMVFRIAQPNSFISPYKKIGITFDTDNDRFNGVSEWGYVDEVPWGGVFPVTLGIISYTSTTGFIRNKSNFSIALKLPSESVSKDSVFYIQFPPYWDSILKSMSAVSCNIIRMADTGKTDFVNNSTLLKDNRIKIYTKLDQESSKENAYIIKINDFPTPPQPTSSMPMWISVFQTTSDDKTVSKTTAPGYINSSYFIYTINPNQQSPVWIRRVGENRRILDSNDYLEVYLGHYNSVVYIGYQDEKSTATVSYEITFGGTIANSLLCWPVRPMVVFGIKEQKIMFASKGGVVPGKYYLSVSKTGDDGNLNSQVPNLPLLIKNQSCQINANMPHYKVPSGGVTLPILFDFSPCMPITDVEITGAVNSREKYNISFVRNNNAEIVQSIKFLFRGFSDTRIIFNLFCNNESQVAGQKVDILWKAGGTDGLFYQDPQITTIEIIDPAPFKAAPTVENFFVTPLAGKAVLTIGCSSFGNYFWAIGMNGTMNNITLQEIKKQTLDAKIFQTTRNPDDLFWIIMGYGDQTDLNQNEIQVADVRTGGQYNASVYCSNQLFLESNKTVNAGWNQTDNTGRVARLSLNFTSKLSEAQTLDIACALTKLLGLPPNRIRTQTNQKCNRLRILQTKPTVSISFSVQNWFVIPESSAQVSNSHLTLKEYYDKPNFLDLLMTRTQRGASAFGSVFKAGLIISPQIIPPIGALNKTSKININFKWVYFNTSIINYHGFFIIGVRKRVKTVQVENATNTSTSNNTSENSQSTQNSPFMNQILGNLANTVTRATLRNGYDTDGNLLSPFIYVYAPVNTTIHINLTGLENATNYQMFYMYSNEDPGPDAIYSEMISIDFSTLDPNESLVLRFWIGALSLFAAFIFM